LRFTVRRPASAEVSPCCHRPSGGDVACSVHVGVAWTRVAGLALENRLALTVSGHGVPAYGASLRRVRGRDLLDPTRGFVLQPRSEQAPTAAADTPVQTAFLGNTHTRLLHRSSRRAGHRTHIKCFNSDGIEPARKVRGGFFDPIPTSVSLAGPKFCDRALRANSPVRPMLGAGRGQLSALLVITRRATTRLPVQLLLDRQVPYVAGMPAMLGQDHRLLGSRKQPISRHPRNLTITTDNPPNGDAALPTWAKAWAFHAVTRR
jgi:hypothetical protein